MIKKIVNYFKNKKLEKINKIENRCKEILTKLPEKSFSKKFYSFNRLDKEILLLKIGKDVIDISKIRKKHGVTINLVILDELFKKYDLSKANLIHQHTEGRIEISPNDLMIFCKCFKEYKISNFTILLIDKEYNQIGRLQYTFTDEFKTKLTSESLNYIYLEYLRLGNPRNTNIHSNSYLLSKGIIRKVKLFSKDYIINKDGNLEGRYEKELRDIVG